MRTIVQTAYAVLMVTGLSTAAHAGDVSVIMLSAAGGLIANGNYYQTYLANKGTSARSIDALHFKRTSGTNLLDPVLLLTSNLGTGWDKVGPNNPTGPIQLQGYSFNKAILNFTGSYSLAAGSRVPLVNVEGGNPNAWLFRSTIHTPATATGASWQVGMRVDGVVEYSNQFCRALEGDANMDGIINSVDVAICNGYTTGQSVTGTFATPTWTMCDFDADGVVEAAEKNYPTTNLNKQCSSNGTYQ